MDARTLLRREFEEHGTKIRALSDRGDESPEGELTDGILDQLAKFERAKTAERSRRGKLQKARQGKVIAIHTPNYGFRYNATRDGYEVDEETMPTVRRIVQMIGAEGRTLYAVKRTLERDGVPTPSGSSRLWAPKVLRSLILDDTYRPHSHEELMAMVKAGQMSADVYGRLDSEKRYGIWWFNRRRTKRTQVVEAAVGGERSYRTRSRYVYRPKEEWVAVPVPDSGIPPDLVDLAREAIRDNTSPSAAGRRKWELSGGIFQCGECHTNMMSHSVAGARVKGRLFYYCCRQRYRDGAEGCSHKRNRRADDVEPLVWEFVSGLLKEQERLRAGLERLIEQERAAMRGDPERETKAWLEKLSEVDQERRGYLRLAAKGRITDEELDEALVELEETRKTAESELETLRSRRKVFEELERDRDTLLERYARMVPPALDELTADERRQDYKMLRLRVLSYRDGTLEVIGVFGDRFLPENQDGRLRRSQAASRDRFRTSTRSPHPPQTSLHPLPGSATPPS